MRIGLPSVDGQWSVRKGLAGVSACHGESGPPATSAGIACAYALPACIQPPDDADRQYSAADSRYTCRVKKISENILDAIGHTPMVRINAITRGVIKATVLAKVETFNPGNSIKDRMAVRMIEDAERRGELKPGGTIIEGTSGNTGMGLAIAAVVKGYKCIFTTTDKQSKEKADALRAFGAEVIVCPTNVDPEDPRSYYSVSSRLQKDVPNSWKANQYDNLSNSAAHYEQTGPEIWEQADGAVTHLVVGVGTGGTISGVGRYLKERNPKIKVWGIDTYGSVFKKYKETGIFDKNEIYPYITEGIGEDFLPKNVDFDVIDHFEKVTDKDAAIMTRRIAREEGIFAGNSAGSAMAGVLQLKDHFKDDDVVVVIFHDHGSRYLGKMFNDDWMREKGFLEKSGMAARDLVASGLSGELFAVEERELVAHAMRVMAEHDFSQISITRDKRLVGSLNETRLYAELVRNSGVKAQPVESIMQPAFPFVDISTPVDLLSTMITPENPAVLVRDFKTDKTFIITRSDVIRVL
jgi:cystathionine beta-synthase